MEKQVNCGLLAHVDAGKTTLSEAMLFLSGTVRKAGRVDHKDTFLDTDAMERERGITIFSKQARLRWREASVTLLDTPGHADLGGEMERTLRVMDCAVLLLSGPEGVQGHTRTVWKLLEKYHVPVFLFINKADMTGYDADKTLKEIREKLSDHCVPFPAAENAEEIAMCDEQALDEYMESGAVSEKTLRRLIAARKLFPVCSGSALKMQGVEDLLDLIVNYAPKAPSGEAFGAKVYKISRDKQDARVTWLKVTGGMLKARDIIRYTGRDGAEKEEKIDTIRLYSGEKYEQTDTVTAGCVCAVTGPENTYPGLGLGSEKSDDSCVLEPVFTYRVLHPGCDEHRCLTALRRLEEEDPLLRVTHRAVPREIRVSLMGDVHLEVLIRAMKDRFGIAIGVDDGGILYKETITIRAEGVGHYEPLRHYAEVHLRLEPLPRGSGLVLTTDCDENKLERNWQRLILTHLYEKQYIGVLTGSPITDMKITLVAGRAHLKHTEGGDFRQATYRAVRNGLMYAESLLLEPVYDFTLTVPQAQVGRAMTDLERMGAAFGAPVETSEGLVLTGRAPAGRMRGYLREVTAYTGGRGALECVPGGYEPCPEAENVIRAYGYDPVRDVDNTPDSVFCSHGAGFIVPWNEVRNFMHLELEQKERLIPAAAAPAAPVKQQERKSAIEEDKELLAIFERTYGPLKNRAFDKPSRPAPVLENR